MAKETRCFVCKKIINPDHPRLSGLGHSICMACEFAEIEVFRITKPNGKDSLFVAIQDRSTLEVLIDEMAVDDSYTITLEKMKATDYLSLPEFEGF